MFKISLENALSMRDARLREVLVKNKVIVLESDCAVPKHVFKSLCRKIGIVYRNKSGSNFYVEDDPEVLSVSNVVKDKVARGLFGQFNLSWHNDFAHSPGEYHGTALYNYFNGEAAPIIFVDAVKLLKSLEPIIVQKMENQFGSHRVSIEAYQEQLPESVRRLARRTNYMFKGNFSPECVHPEPHKRPFIQTHPITKEQSIYLSPATLIPEGLSFEIEPILKKMEEQKFAYAYQPFDIVLFDNLSLMHRRDRYDDEARILHRIQFSLGI